MQLSKFESGKWYIITAENRADLIRRYDANQQIFDFLEYITGTKEDADLRFMCKESHFGNVDEICFPGSDVADSDLEHFLSDEGFSSWFTSTEARYFTLDHVRNGEIGDVLEYIFEHFDLKIREKAQFWSDDNIKDKDHLMLVLENHKEEQKKKQQLEEKRLTVEAKRAEIEKLQEEIKALEEAE